MWCKEGEDEAMRCKEGEDAAMRCKEGEDEAVRCKKVEAMMHVPRELLQHACIRQARVRNELLHRTPNVCLACKPSII